MRKALKDISPFKMFMAVTCAMFVMVAVSVPSAVHSLDEAILSDATSSEAFQVTAGAK